MDAGSPRSTSQNTSEVDQWLEVVDKAKYAAAFRKAGLMRLRQVAELTREGLKKIVGELDSREMRDIISEVEVLRIAIQKIETEELKRQGEQQKSQEKGKGDDIDEDTDDSSDEESDEEDIKERERKLAEERKRETEKERERKAAEAEALRKEKEKKEKELKEKELEREKERERQREAERKWEEEKIAAKRAEQLKERDSKKRFDEQGKGGAPVGLGVGVGLGLGWGRGRGAAAEGDHKYKVMEKKLILAETEKEQLKTEIEMLKLQIEILQVEMEGIHTERALVEISSAPNSPHRNDNIIKKDSTSPRSDPKTEKYPQSLHKNSISPRKEVEGKYPASATITHQKQHPNEDEKKSSNFNSLREYVEELREVALQVCSTLREDDLSDSKTEKLLSRLER